MTDIPDEAVEWARDAASREGAFLNAEAMRAALEAAYPLLPKPMLNREAMLAAIVNASEPEGSDCILGREYVENYADVFVDAIMQLVRPVPTREATEQTLRSYVETHGSGDEHPDDMVRDLADAIGALLAGE